MGQGDSNFSSEQQIVQKLKLETASSDGQWPMCIIYSQSFLQQMIEIAKQHDGPLLWTSHLDHCYLDRISKKNLWKETNIVANFIAWHSNFFERVVVLKLGKAGGGGGRRRGRKHLTLIFITNITILTTIGKFL